jgi:DNA-directed RNA polymerase sigma subunit (sigma70/sigma32)
MTVRKAERHKKAYRLYKMGLTLEEVGKVFGVTRERIRQGNAWYDMHLRSEEGRLALRIKFRLDPIDGHPVDPLEGCF